MAKKTVTRSSKSRQKVAVDPNSVEAFRADIKAKLEARRAARAPVEAEFARRTVTRHVVNLEDLEFRLSRVVHTLDILSDRCESSARGFIDAFTQNCGTDPRSRAALGRALQREAAAGLALLLEVTHLAGELVGRADALDGVRAEEVEVQS